jgi:predicted nucleotidyltransferase
MMPLPLLKKQVEQHPYPLVFATVSGAHLYGFPSAEQAHKASKLPERPRSGAALHDLLVRLRLSKNV